MKRLGNILVLSLMALMLSPAPSASAQQSQEQMAAYYFDNGEFQQAEQLYEGLYKQTSNKYYYQRLLSTYLELEQYKDAQRLVERRQKANPKELQLMVDEGQVYARQGQEKKARKCYEKAIESITNNLQPVPDLAQAFFGMGLPDYAARTYLKARMQSRNVPSISMNL